MTERAQKVLGGAFGVAVAFVAVLVILALTAVLLGAFAAVVVLTFTALAG